MLLAAIGASSVFASPSDCSPGYWKNHTELWMDGPGGQFTVADEYWLITALTAKGWQDEFADRFNASAVLNSIPGLGANCDD
jgi:hypothetical protein